MLTFPVEHAADALELLESELETFIEMAIARVRTPSVWKTFSRSRRLLASVSSAATYLSRRRLRNQKMPKPWTKYPMTTMYGASREPRIRGRAPIFEHGQRSIASLMSDIEREVIALPDLQRPFVWEDTKVRDLLDSLFVGFPVGTLVFWHPSNEKTARAVGADRPGLRATTLVIDGQQRLTSLYAVM